MINTQNSWIDNSKNLLPNVQCYRLWPIQLKSRPIFCIGEVSVGFAPSRQKMNCGTVPSQVQGFVFVFAVLPWNSCWSIYPSRWQMGSSAYSYLCSLYSSGFYTLPASSCSLVPTLRGKIQVCTDLQMTSFPSCVCTQNSVSECEHKCQAGIPCCLQSNGKASRTWQLVTRKQHHKLPHSYL